MEWQVYPALLYMTSSENETPDLQIKPVALLTEVPNLIVHCLLLMLILYNYTILPGRKSLQYMLLFIYLNITILKNHHPQQNTRRKPHASLLYDLNACYCYTCCTLVWNSNQKLAVEKENRGEGRAKWVGFSPNIHAKGRGVALDL